MKKIIIAIVLMLTGCVSPDFPLTIMSKALPETLRRKHPETSITDSTRCHYSALTSKGHWRYFEDYWCRYEIGEQINVKIDQ